MMRTEPRELSLQAGGDCSSNIPHTQFFISGNRQSFTDSYSVPDTIVSTSASYQKIILPSYDQQVYSPMAVRKSGVPCGCDPPIVGAGN